MESHSFLNETYIILLVVVVMGGYYFAFWKYNKYLKNKESVKNFNEKTKEVKNIHIFTENIESVPSYNKKEILPVIIDNKSNDWKKILNDIQDQSLELNTNNNLDQFLNEMDIDLKD